mgnify:FL=1
MEKALKEYRLSEVRALDTNENEMIIEGYAAVFDEITDMGWYREKVDRHAFDNADMKDCVLKYNHEDSFLILARTRNGSLELKIDDHGLKIRAKLIDTTNNKDVYKMIKEGLLDKMSFGFSVQEQAWDYDTDTRTILRISKLFDVSVVDFPAYDGTDIKTRKKDDYLLEKSKYLEFKTKRKKLELKLKLLDL